jgi:hypothetical protein
MNSDATTVASLMKTSDAWHSLSSIEPFDIDDEHKVFDLPTTATEGQLDAEPLC